MTAPADRHRVLRAALTAAIRLTGIVSRGHTAALTAAVWRVVEPALAQRDAQLDAVREVVAAMDGITGAGFWAQQLHAALRPQPPAAAITQPPLTWCAASMPGVGGEPIGPCVLRAGHDGTVQQGPRQPPTPRCPNCQHPMGDHSVYAPPLRPRPTWCHACDTHCGHNADAAERAAAYVPVDGEEAATGHTRVDESSDPD